jgi:hypothetical protein
MSFVPSQVWRSASPNAQRCRIQIQLRGHPKSLWYFRPHDPILGCLRYQPRIAQLPLARAVLLYSILNAWECASRTNQLHTGQVAQVSQYSLKRRANGGGGNLASFDANSEVFFIANRSRVMKNVLSRETLVRADRPCLVMGRRPSNEGTKPGSRIGGKPEAILPYHSERARVGHSSLLCEITARCRFHFSPEPKQQEQQF